MKFETTPAFEADLKRLSAAELDAFRTVVRDRFHGAAEAFVGSRIPFPRALRVRAVEGARGVWEMTWSFSGPDGRATFEWVTIDGAAAVRWRRVGGHAVFSRP